jgi:hypothetical protein
MSTPKKDIQKKEKMARKVSKYIKNHPIQSDDDGNVLTGPLDVKEGWVEITQNTDVDLLTEDLENNRNEMEILSKTRFK